MSYASPADLMLRFDRNDVGQLCSDDKRPVSEVDLPGNAQCLAALADASGQVDAALLVGNRYSVADLTTLSETSTSLLKRVTCEIAMAMLIGRRPGWNPEKAKVIREMASEQLERLRKGENTFNIQASMDAAEPTTDGPSTLTYNQLNLWRDRTRNFFPNRVLPNNR
jgi:phage gp36-like protein